MCVAMGESVLGAVEACGRFVEYEGDQQRELHFRKLDVRAEGLSTGVDSHARTGVGTLFARPCILNVEFWKSTSANEGGDG